MRSPPKDLLPQPRRPVERPPGGGVAGGFVNNRTQEEGRQPLDPARQSFCDARQLFSRRTLRGLPRPSIHRLTGTARELPVGLAFAAVDHRVGPSTCATISNVPGRPLKGFAMKRVSLVFTLALAAGFSTQAAIGANAQDGQGPGHAILRRQPGPAGLFLARRQGQLDRARRRRLPRDRGRHLRRSDQGQVRAAVGQGPLHGAAIRRNRRAVAQYDLDAVARHLARRQFHRRDLLRRPGLSGEEVAQGEFRAGAEQRVGLRADRHHDRAESRRLLQEQQHEVRGDRIRHRGRNRQGLRIRAAATSSPRTCRSSMPSA